MPARLRLLAVLALTRAANTSETLVPPNPKEGENHVDVALFRMMRYRSIGARPMDYQD
jgi:hypothetical protein